MKARLISLLRARREDCVVTNIYKLFYTLDVKGEAERQLDWCQDN